MPKLQQLRYDMNAARTYSQITSPSYETAPQKKRRHISDEGYK